MKRALLIGINDYPTAPLRGCINDISDMASFLVEKCNFSMSEIRLLADGRATTNNIIEHLNWLVDGVMPGDYIFFHYSGHGTQMATRDHQGELDGLDEVICPVDFDWTDAHVIRDKDFKRIFSSIPMGTEFVWVSDSCHAGNLSRLMSPINVVARHFPIPIDIQWRIDTAASLGINALMFSRAVEQTNNVALISGCQPDQTSADAVFNGRPNGALTYFLLEALKEEGGMNLPLDRLLDVVRKKISMTGKYQQVPGVEGSLAIINRSFLSI